MAQVATAVAALLLAPWLFRTLTLLESTAGSEAADMRGFVADAAVGLALLALLWILARWARWLAVFVVGVLAVGYYANYETITALGSIVSPLDLKFLTDPTFVRGSALAISHPVLLAFGLSASLALAWVGLRGASRTDPLLALAGAGFLFGVLSIWPSDPDRAQWRLVNAVRYNVEWIALRDSGSDRGDFGSPAEAMRELVPEIGADLDAPPRFALDGRGKNVLLVVLEGVSGGYLKAAAKHHERGPFYPLKRLDRTFARNVGYATFFNHQRRTNRGLFGILCGEYPRLVAGMPKMSVTAGAPWRRCLPELLREHGYRTVYLQAAPLAFMQKDRFMPAIGFDETLGHDWFKRPYQHTYWGVDDQTLFEEAFRKIEELETRDEPWFLTVLNVGTHHPYTVPASFETPYHDEFRRAFNFMDQQFDRFLRQFERRGLRDDTLVLVTSDESIGDLQTTQDGLASTLTQNWGFLIALTPERTQFLVDGVFAQSDIPLSILDYLGLSGGEEEFFGRSVFRQYDRPRKTFYGNVNFRIIGGLDDDGSIVQCLDEGRQCARYRPLHDLVFGDSFRRVPNNERFAETVREMARRSLPPRDSGPLAVPLLASPVVEVRTEDWQIVQGFAQLSLETDEWYEVDMELEVRGEGAVDYVHSSRVVGKRPIIVLIARIEPGQTFRLRYTVATDVRLRTSTFWTRARLVDAESPADLVFRKRRFELRRGDDRPASGVQLLVNEIDSPTNDWSEGRVTTVPIEKYYPFLRRREQQGMPPEDLVEAEENTGR